MQGVAWGADKHGPTRRTDGEGGRYSEGVGVGVARIMVIRAAQIRREKKYIVLVFDNRSLGSQFWPTLAQLG